jgi:hypothetical protein
MADDVLYSSQIVIHTDTSSVKPALNQVKGEFDHAAKEAESAGERIEKSLKKMKQATGRRSAIGEISEVLQGAGAVAGIALVSEALEKATGKAAELVDEYRKGEMAGGDVAYSIARSLPIIGQMIKACENVHEIITGEHAAQEKINAEIEYGNELYATRTKLDKSNEDSNIAAEAKMGAASNRLREANAQPGLDRTVLQKQDATNTQEGQLRLEYSPMMNDRRKQEAKDALVDQRNKEAKGVTSADMSDAEKAAKLKKIDKEYQEKSEITSKDIDKYNADLAIRNQATIKILDKATAAEIKEIESGTEEIFAIRLGAANKLAETKAGKLENFRAEKQQEGFKGPALDNLVQAKSEDLQAEAMKGTRDALRSLNQEYDNSEATTFTEKVAANRKQLEEEARTGKITADSIDDLNAAFAKVQLAEVDNKLKDAAIALGDVGKTDIEKQVEALQKMGANAEQAAKYAADLKATLTGNDIADINKQLALVGKNPLQAAGITANQQGADGAQVAQATGKLLGAQLTESVRTPFENFGRTIDYYKELLQQGDISQKTFQLLQLKAFNDLVANTTRSDIDSAAKDRIANQFAGAGVAMALAKGANGGGGIPAVNDLNKKADADKKKKDDMAKNDKTNKSTDKLTDANTELKQSVDNLTLAFNNGIAAVAV